MRGRRANGEGTIYEEMIKGNATGRWRGEVSHTDPATGKMDRHKITGRARSDVETKMKKLRAELTLQGVVKKRREIVGPLFSEYVETWLSSKKVQINERTYALYESLVKHHLLPVFGQMRMSKISKEMIDTWVDSPYNSTRKYESGKVGSAPNFRDGKGARMNALRRLASILRDANDGGIIAKVPIRRFTYRYSGAIRNVLNETQQKDFLKAVQGTHLEALFIVALATGMRESEICGLEWRDIEDTLINVNRQIIQDTGKSEALKTAYSRRRVLIPMEVREAIEAHRKRAVKRGTPVGPNDLVFVNTSGKMVRVSNMTRSCFRPALKKAEITFPITFHDLRHSHASLLISKGVNIYIVSRRLGHKDIVTTLRTYTHLMQGDEEQALGALTNIFGPPQITAT